MKQAGFWLFLLFLRIQARAFADKRYAIFASFGAWRGLAVAGLMTWMELLADWQTDCQKLMLWRLTFKTVSDSLDVL